jgi:glycosyltransferase involved in cell wall biosynthesis
MRRVLIVTSSYAPTMIADMQRVRQLVWELPKLGWEVEVLSPSTEYQPATCVDQDSAGFFSPNLGVHYVHEMWPYLFRIGGVGSIGWRALLPMRFVGRRLLQQRHFDLIYISTAHFPLFLLGPMWQRQFGVPYVLDLHDPLYKEGSHHPVWARPRLKHRVSNALAKVLEEHVATWAQGLTAVSPNYIDTLRLRHEAKQPAWLRPGRFDAIPFSALPRDLCEAAAALPSNAKKDGPPYSIVYVGVGGPVMARSFTLFSRALSQLRMQSGNLCEGIRVELFGTMLGWHPGEARGLADIAAKWGIGDLVREEPGRLSYRRSLELLLQSDGALIFGVEDAGYMPSKLFTYALSGKPLLATLHCEGPAFSMFKNIPDLGHALWIGQNDDMPLEEAMNVLETFLREVVARKTFDRSISITPYLAPAMARRHGELFEACLSTGRSCSGG